MSHYSEQMEDRWRRQVKATAAKLRMLADEIETFEEPPKDLKDMKPNFLEAGSRAVHALSSGWANLHVDYVSLVAAEAHIAARRPEEQA